MANCYVVVDETSHEAMIVDPGGDGEHICKEVEALAAKPIYLVNTHGHVDHIEANATIREHFPDIKICIHEADAEMLAHADKNLSHFMGTPVTSPEADVLFNNENNRITLGDSVLEVIHLPGHSPGSVCLLHRSTPAIIITGDTLFAQGIGRTDFPDPERSERENFDLLVGGIREKIFSLPEDTVVYPGHGPSTTVGREKRSNPYCA